MERFLFMNKEKRCSKTKQLGKILQEHNASVIALIIDQYHHYYFGINLKLRLK